MALSDSNHKNVLIIFKFITTRRNGQLKKSYIYIYQSERKKNVILERDGQMDTQTNTGHSQLLKTIILKFTSSSIALLTMCNS